MDFQLGVNASAETFSTYKFDQDAIRKALAYMLVVDELSLKFIEMEGFRHFIFVACPKFLMPSRHTISRDRYDLYLDERNKLKDLFKNTNQRVYLTTGTWSSL